MNFKPGDFVQYKKNHVQHNSGARVFFSFKLPKKHKLLVIATEKNKYTYPLKDIVFKVVNPPSLTGVRWDHPCCFELWKSIANYL